MNNLSRYIFIGLAVISTVLAWYHMSFIADTLNQFYSDEVANVQSSDSFFSSLNYHNDQYGYVFSSGPAVTWPGGLGWKIAHNMFASRLSCTFFSWAFFIMLGIWFFRREGFSCTNAFISSTTLWAMTITTPLAMPYWFGFIYDLGELNSIILIGFGIMLLTRVPLASVFIFGLAVWYGKIIYAPLVGAIILGNILSEKLRLRKALSQLLISFIIFISPLLAWALLIYLRVNSHAMHQWLAGQLTWLSNMKESHEAVAQASGSHAHWFKRFSSPDLEWCHYTTGTKIKNLIFSVGAIFLTGFSLIFFKKSTDLISKKLLWISVLVTICLAAYTFHFFFLHPYMYQRHFQPALYTGFGLWVFWATKWLIYFKNRLGNLLIILMLLILILQYHESKKHPLISDTMTYARSCTELSGLSCNPDHLHRKFFQE